MLITHEGLLCRFLHERSSLKTFVSIPLIFSVLLSGS